MSIDDSTRAWVTSKFGKLEDDTLKSLLSIKDIFQYSNEDLYVHWEAFVMTQGNGDMDISLVNLERFQLHLQVQLSSLHLKLTPLKSDSKRKPLIKRPFSSSYSSSPVPAKRKPDIPSDLHSSPSKRVASSPVRSSQAKPSDSVLECLNPEMEPVENPSPLQLTANFDPAKFSFRTMAMKLLESADVLDDQIDTFSLQLASQHSECQFGNPCLSSQTDILCCGRIVPDSPFDDGTNLNDKSLQLETSRLGGVGQRIPLDLGNLDEFLFFPGQIVGFKGRNPTGSTFVVLEVVELPPLGSPASTLSELESFYESGDGAKIFVAAGPYGSQHSLTFSKLELLVARINDAKPQVAVLLGPFIDLTSKVVESGDVDVEGARTMDDLFKLVVVPILSGIDPSVSVVLIPSLRDAVSKHGSFPQAQFDRKALGLPKNIKCFPNPSSFLVNEIVVSTANVDVFRDLKDVYKAGAQRRVPPNRFDRIASHIFEQRRYYPMFPGSVKKRVLQPEEKSSQAALAEGIEDAVDVAFGGASLELPYMGLAELGDSLPDILIAPSDLKYFARIVKGVVIINPGQLVRASSDPEREDGSYVVIDVKPPKALEDNNVTEVTGTDLYHHNVHKRCRVEILQS